MSVTLKSFGTSVATLALFSVLTAPVSVASTQDFTIPTFESDYYLSRDAAHVSHLRVHEHIVAQFPQTDQNHGILRAIPDSYDGHTLDLHIQSVTADNGDAENYTASTDNHNRVLKIGDAGRYVHGLQSYDIDYTMDNVTTTQAGLDAHIWNVNGTHWQQTFGQVTARLHLTSDLMATQQAGKTACYTGPAGSTAQSCTISTAFGDGGDTVTTFTATRPLEAGETLSYQTDFTAGTFAPFSLTPTQLLTIIATIVLVYILPVVITLAVVIGRWHKYGRDPAGRGIIIAQYVPPKDISVLGSSSLLRESFDLKSISAQIIDLAVRGYIKIYEIKQTKLLRPDSETYELELIQDPTDLRPEESSVATMVFGAAVTVGTRVNLSTLKNKLYSDAKTLGKSVDLGLVTSGFFRSDPDSAKSPYVATGSALLVFEFFFWHATLGLLIPGLILLVAARFMPARTQAGVDMRDYLLGLKEYMKLAEADRIKMLQSPHGELTEKIDVSDNVALVKLYEKLLPYAMLFGIEKDWAKQFAGLYQQAPDWYAGSSNFSSGYFIGSLANFNAASTASFTPPASSGSGGGFAGGGGGGGGGGGW